MKRSKLLKLLTASVLALSNHAVACHSGTVGLAVGTIGLTHTWSCHDDGSKTLIFSFDNCLQWAPNKACAHYVGTTISSEEFPAIHDKMERELDHGLTLKQLQYLQGPVTAGLMGIEGLKQAETDPDKIKRLELRGRTLLSGLFLIH